MIDQTTGEVLEQSAIMPVMNVQMAISRFSQIAEFIKELMKQDVDFGIIPGTDKPTLLKPGAEKLTTLFGLTKRFEVISSTEDWTGKDHNGEPFFNYLYRCSLYRADLLIAEADGSCNSFESKYRYRKAERICTECGQANIRKSKNNPGWYCWTKTGGCGANFPAGDVNIESQEVGRIPNPDVCDQVNTFQKMAQKRALVAATLLAVNASEFFTQDMEDYITVDVTPVEVQQKNEETSTPHKKQSNGKQPKQRPLSPQDLQASVKIKVKDLTGKPNKKQLDYALSSLSKLVDNNDDVRHQVSQFLFGKESSKEWTSGECSFLIDWIGANKANDYTPSEDAKKEASNILDMLTDEIAF